jgi:hypothetical protein
MDDERVDKALNGNPEQQKNTIHTGHIKPDHIRLTPSPLSFEPQQHKTTLESH